MDPRKGRADGRDERWVEGLVDGDEHARRRGPTGEGRPALLDRRSDCHGGIDVVTVPDRHGEQ